MKKSIGITFMVVCALIILIWYCFVLRGNVVDIKIDGVKIDNFAWDEIINYNNEIIGFAMNDYESELFKTQSLGWRVIVLDCKFSNMSFKQLGGIQLYFANKQELPQFIIGEKLDAWGRVETLFVKSFQRDVSYRFGILIRDDEHSDDELIEMIKDVKLIITEYGTAISEPFEIKKVIR